MSYPPSSTLYFVSNGLLGEPLLATTFGEYNGDTAQVVWRGDHDPFGNLLAPASTWPDLTLNIGISGMYYDSESGFYYDHYRYYDPTTGRFLQASPLLFAGAPEVAYSYAGGNPLLNIDLDALRITSSSAVTTIYYTPKSNALSTLGNTDPRFWPHGAKEPTACAQNQTNGSWGFDLDVDTNIIVTLPTGKRNQNRIAYNNVRGKKRTIRGHEFYLHVRDYRKACKNINKAIKTDGFPTEVECNAARKAVTNNVGNYFTAAAAQSRAKWEPPPGTSE